MMYWALSCDVSRHIVTSSIAAHRRDEVDRLYVSGGEVLAGDRRLRDFFNPLQPCGGLGSRLVPAVETRVEEASDGL
jgi:hypothetical protein